MDFKDCEEKAEWILCVFTSILTKQAQKNSQKEPFKKGLLDVNKYGGVAQLGEHLLCKQGVIGSIPFISTKTGS